MQAKVVRGQKYAYKFFDIFLFLGYVKLSHRRVPWETGIDSNNCLVANKISKNKCQDFSKIFLPDKRYKFRQPVRKCKQANTKKNIYKHIQTILSLSFYYFIFY